MFAALERGDLKRWPKGLFRRSFFRDYVRMIGLPVAETTDEFVRLFPDDTAKELTRAAAAANDGDESSALRLAFDTAWHGPRTSVLSRLLVVPIRRRRRHPHRVRARMVGGMGPVRDDHHRRAGVLLPGYGDFRRKSHEVGRLQAPVRHRRAEPRFDCRRSSVAAERRLDLASGRRHRRRRT